MKLIYLLPSFYKSTRKSTLGLYKDIINIENYFSDKKIKYKKYFTNKDFFSKKDNKIFQNILRINPNFIFLEKYLSLKFILILFLMKKFKLKKTRIIYRSHNAELFHRLDFIKACFYQIKLKKSNILKFKLILNSIKNLILIPFKEFLIVLFVDVILSTNEWENKNYWQKIYFTKAFSLHPFIENKVKHKIKTKKIIEDVCLIPCAKPTNIIANDQLIFLLNKIQKFKYLGIKFLFTGEIPEYLKKNILFFAKKNKLDKNLFYFLENKRNINIKNFFLQNINPLQLGFDNKISFEKICLSTNKSLILSNLGYGVKTKILELIAFNHTVFINEKVFYQQDEIVKKNTKKFSSIHELKKKIKKKTYVNKNINVFLKKNYYSVLNKIFKRINDSN